MSERSKFEFFGLKVEAEGALAVKITAVLTVVGLLTMLGITFLT